MNLHRGFLRLGIGLAVLWFVFWSFAYVLIPQHWESAPLPPAFSVRTDIAVLVVGILSVPWIVLGFRPN